MVFCAFSYSDAGSRSIGRIVRYRCQAARVTVNDILFVYHYPHAFALGKTAENTIVIFLMCSDGTKPQNEQM